MKEFGVIITTQTMPEAFKTMYETGLHFWFWFLYILLTLVGLHLIITKYKEVVSLLGDLLGGVHTGELKVMDFCNIYILLFGVVTLVFPTFMVIDALKG